MVARLQGMKEVNPKAAEIEESNALALAIIQPGRLEDSPFFFFLEFFTFPLKKNVLTVLFYL